MNDRWINTLRPEQNGRHFAADIEKCISWKNIFIFSYNFLLSFFPWGPTSVQDSVGLCDGLGTKQGINWTHGEQIHLYPVVSMGQNELIGGFQWLPPLKLDVGSLILGYIPEQMLCVNNGVTSFLHQTTIISIFPYYNIQ